jgi:alpha-glucosidase (family GH31 glycosyl hydrolase)
VKRVLLGSWSAFVLVGLFACGDDGTTSTTSGGGAGGAGGGPDCAVTRTEADDAAPPPIHTPRWAFHPWISKDISTADDSRAFVQGFRDRDIPVGVLVIDSPWETYYNTFTPNPSRYPEFATMVSDFRAQGVRTVLWTTQMVNTGNYDLEPTGDVYDGPSPDWDPMQACDWFVSDNHVYGWWKGQGSAIDFFDQDARVAWHRIQDRALDLGISGFKLDFGENYIDEIPIRTDDGDKTRQEYSEAYYRDFYAYGSAKLGPDEFVTMVRPYDKSYQFEGRFFARPEHAPVTWVGDNRRDYVGMQDALDHIMRSANAGYVVVGSDIGGYLDRDDQDLTVMIPFDSGVFQRWTALGAMMPFMQLHGRANLTPWATPTDPEQSEATYKFWATLHEQLVPFFDSVATQQYAGSAVKMIDPVPDEADWPDDYRYLLGGAFLVVPVVDGSGARDVLIPDDASYFDLFDPAGAEIPASTLLASVDVSDPSRIPVYVRDGAIVPMEVTNDTTPFGNAASAGARTLLVFPATTPSSFEVVGEDHATELTVDAVRTAGTTTIGLGARDRTVILRVRVPMSPTAVTFAGAALAAAPDRTTFDASASGYFVDGGFVWIRVPSGAAGDLTLE